MSTRYKFVRRVAYTEDEIVIMNIRACCLVSKNITIRDIKKYFKKFGKIVNVLSLDDKDGIQPETLLEDNFTSQNKLRKYEIQYANAISATRALRVDKHLLKNIVIHVTSCPSIEQPDFQKIITQIHLNDCSGQNNQALITTLNDDCLEHICKFLTPAEQVNFALSCRRFAAILALLSKVQHKNFDFIVLMDMTMFQMHIFLRIVGPQIKSLTANMDLLYQGFGTEYDINPFLGTVLINVEKLKVIENHSNTLCKLMEKMHLLQELELVLSTVDDKFIKFLETFKNLKKLKITDNSDITGSGIRNLTRLEQLTLYDCPGISHFKDICKSLTNLNYLEVICNLYSSSLDTEDYEHIANYLLQLKTLKIGCKEGNPNCLAQLPNLLKLQVKLINFEVTEEFLVHLAKHQANKLEELDITSLQFTKKAATSVAKLKKLKVLKCHFSVDDEVLEIFSNIKELEEIEFWETTDFTYRGILKLLEYCLNLKRICFWCSSTELKDLVCKSRKFLENQHQRGYRTGCVHFVFKSKIGLPFVADYELSDILRITDELTGDEDYDEWFGDISCHGGDDIYDDFFDDDDDDDYDDVFGYFDYSSDGDIFFPYNNNFDFDYEYH